MKALVGAFNQEKALVGAFSVIMNLRMELFKALITAQGVCRLKLLNTALAAIHSNFPNDPPVLQIVLSVP